MDLSSFLAQLMGLGIAFVAVAGLLRPQLFSAAIRDFDHEQFSTFAIGFIAVIAGLAVVLSHNIWDGTWRVWVTLFGWASLLKGLTYLAAPKFLMGLARWFLGNKTWMRGYLILALLVGAYLAWKGFGY